MTCVVVDDEPIAAQGIAGYIDKIGWLECIGVYDSALSLDRHLNVEGIAPDIIFIDVEMPGMNGMDYLASCRVTSAVVVITAYEEFALRGFDLDVTDYLLKPVSFTRFLRAVEKVRRQCAQGTGADTVAVKADGATHLIRLRELQCVEAMENYVKLHTLSGTIVIRATMSRVMEMLPGRRFVRVHKSFAVNLSTVVRIERTFLVNDSGMRIPVSRTFRQSLESRLAEGTDSW